MSGIAFTFMGLMIHPYSMHETIDKFHEALKNRTRLHHGAMNVAKLVRCQTQPELRADIESSDIISIDGMGVLWGARMLGHHVPERVTGIDLMHEILKLCEREGFRPFFWGARAEVLEKAVKNIQKTFPALSIAGSRNGYFKTDEEQEIITKINQSKADCLFIAISTPLKERLMAQHKDKLQVPVIMGVGGSIDIWAGITARAPKWMQRLGLEWVFRIIQEPRRMAARYLRTNTMYVWLLLKESFRPQHMMKPAEK